MEQPTYHETSQREADSSNPLEFGGTDSLAGPHTDAPGTFSPEISQSLHAGPSMTDTGRCDSAFTPVSSLPMSSASSSASEWSTGGGSDHSRDPHSQAEHIQHLQHLTSWKQHQTASSAGKARVNIRVDSTTHDLPLYDLSPSPGMQAAWWSACCLIDVTDGTSAGVLVQASATAAILPVIMSHEYQQTCIRAQSHPQQIHCQGPDLVQSRPGAAC